MNALELAGWLFLLDNVHFLAYETLSEKNRDILCKSKREKVSRRFFHDPQSFMFRPYC